MFEKRLVLCVLATMAPLACAEDAPEASGLQPANLAVVVFNPRGLAIDPPSPYAGYNNSLSAGWYGGMGGQIAEEINRSIEAKRRRKALGPEWEALDHDDLDARLLQIARCDVDRSRLKPEAPIKELKDFGPNMAMFLQRYTPGIVLVYDVRMGFTAELEEIYFKIEESVWDFRYRAKSKRELKRVPKDEVAWHRPTILSTVTHQFVYSPVAKPDKPMTLVQDYTGEMGQTWGSAASADSTDTASTAMGYESFGSLWRANGSALLKRKIEEGFKHLESTIDGDAGADCLKHTAAAD